MDLWNLVKMMIGQFVLGLELGLDNCQYQQTHKLNKSPPKNKKEGFGPWADTKITRTTRILF